MVIKAQHFTPEVMLGASRRGSARPDSDGSRILFTNASYSFEKHEWTREVRIYSACNGESTLVTNHKGASEPQWLGGDAVILLAPASEDKLKGGTEVLVGSPNGFNGEEYSAGLIDGAASNLKVKCLKNGTYLFAVSVAATPDGSMYNSEKEATRNNTGRVYNSLYVRHWDTWITSNRNAIWYGALEKKDGYYRLSKLTNALKGTGLECPIPPFGGSDDFDISENGIVFVAKDPTLNPATNTRSNVYLMAQQDFDGTRSLPAPYEVHINGYDGASSSPTFSKDGMKVAFLQMTKNGYESDRNEIFTLPDIWRPAWTNHLVGFPELKQMWDVSPSSIQWGIHEKMLFVQAEQDGKNCLWTLSSDYLHQGSVPTKIFSKDSVGGVTVLDSGDVFVQASNYVDNSTIFLLSPTSPISYHHQLLHSVSHHGSIFGLSPDQIDDIWYDGAKQKVHAWLIKPSNFDKGKKYPLAYLIHGGPQGAWTNSWSTRWNPAVFAEAGYVAIMPNPTGSTGYGEAFKDAIQNQWGGLPYIDIAKGFEHITNNLEYIDTSRAVALGASYGGYMMNWIQGQPLGRKLKAIVCHDGVYSIAGQTATEELYFPEREFCGKWWKNQESWLKWDPARFTENWATPQLIIHSEKDYRLTVAEGLAAFNILQGKGVDSQFLTFPDENHFVLNPENSLVWHTVVLDFINKRVGLPLYSEQSKIAKAALTEAMIVDPVMHTGNGDEEEGEEK